MCVIVLGAYTRLSDAGLGCPDWPTCYGFFIVPDIKPKSFERPLEATKGWLEMIHRYVASSLGLFIVFIFLLAIKQKKHQTIAIMLLILVIFQGLLGMWTVTKLVHPGIVSMHLFGGFATAVLLFHLGLKNRETS